MYATIVDNAKWAKQFNVYGVDCTSFKKNRNNVNAIIQGYLIQDFGLYFSCFHSVAIKEYYL